MTKQTIYILIALFLCYGCTPETTGNNEEKATVIVEENPALPGFNGKGSDEKAIKIADEVMVAMGGRKAWDALPVLSWNFFNSRKLTWDKISGDVRIDNLRDSSFETVVINLFDTTNVQLKMNGELISQPDSLSKYGRLGKSAWINDSYWVVMPFKLKDSGVTLKYLREDVSEKGEAAHVLQLTFKEVGNTPQNLYEIYVSKEKNLVIQWAFFREQGLEKPNFNLPWGDYKDYNGVMLGTDRGDRDITELEVLSSPSENTFSL